MHFSYELVVHWLTRHNVLQGRIQGGPPNFIKRGKALGVCARIHPVLVVNSYPDPSPLVKILYPPLDCIEGTKIQNLSSLGSFLHEKTVMVYLKYNW